jgi:pyrroline-5-carboxylate reductase
MSIQGKTIGFLGAGNMGEALIKGLLHTGLIPPGAILAADARPERLREVEKLYGIQTLPDNPALVKGADVVILAVKPQVIADVLKEVGPALAPKHLLISIAAGFSTAALRSHLPGKGVRLIRVMPNTPALVLEGATAIARASGLQPGDLETAEEIFGAVGKVVVLEEGLMDAVTGLSGSGPAYIALVVEALADGGVKMGLDRGTALSLATQTVLGAARLLLETRMHPGQLKDMVSSPGGTTIAGIAALEEAGLRRALISAVERATLRSRELGRGNSAG